MVRRQDIDGLRAIAVLPIVFFHAGLSFLVGGFVGVDIFFVISGFLITTILNNDAQDRHFSILRFYHRRIVRIVPALFVMLACVMTFGTMFLLPVESQSLGRAAAATAVFGSNIHFWQTADYFAPAAETQPLLHTWSLGVEEQFYIFYPLLLLLLRKVAPARTRSVLFLVALLSFALGGYLVRTQPTAAFYLLPARAWELAIGGLAAFGMAPRLRHPGVRQSAATGGLALILIGYLVIRASRGFPVPEALLPCLGTALILVYGETTMVGRLLSARPLVYVGHISYSLYLWHWPIIALYLAFTGTHLDRYEAAGLIVASFACAVPSYHFIEQPFLRRFRSARPKRVLSVGIASLALTAFVATFLAFNAHRITAAPHDVVAIADYDDYANTAERAYQFRSGECFPGKAEANLPVHPASCMKLSAGRANILVLGDSHAAQYWRAISLRYPGANVMQANASGCRPLIGATGAARCLAMMHYAFAVVLPTHRVDTVVLAARWQADEFGKLIPTIRSIRNSGARVVVVGPTIEYDGSFPILVARALWSGDAAAVGRLRKQAPHALDARMKAAMASIGVPYIDVQDIICPDGRCRLFAPGGAPMQFDYGHLTFPAARWVVARMPPIAVLPARSGSGAADLARLR